MQTQSVERQLRRLAKRHGLRATKTRHGLWYLTDSRDVDVRKATDPARLINWLEEQPERRQAKS